MNHFQLTRFVCALTLLIGCTGSPDALDEVTSAAPRMKLPDLSQEPLAPAVSLTADYFRQSYPHLAAEQFQQKWTNSQKSGLLFIRSFVNSWYDELARVSSTGPIGPCFGDPHPENFGYLSFAGSFEYTYNDVDDSGACPVAFDALRYFTALKMLVKDKVLEAELRRSYIHFLNGEELAERPSRSLSPDVGIALNKVIKKRTRKGKIKLEGGTVAISPARAQSLFAVMQAIPGACPACKLLDSAQVQVNSGGSAGLDRFWLLIESAEQVQQLIEFKKLTDPASQRGPWAQKQKLTRTEILQDIWGTSWPAYFAFVSMDGESFLMRSRLNADLDLDSLSPDQKKAVLTEQVYLLAQLHKKTINGSTLLEEWLGRQSEFQGRRYGEALLGARGG